MVSYLRHASADAILSGRTVLRGRLCGRVGETTSSSRSAKRFISRFNAGRDVTMRDPSRPYSSFTPLYPFLHNRQSVKWIRPPLKKGKSLLSSFSVNSCCKSISFPPFPIKKGGTTTIHRSSASSVPTRVFRLGAIYCALKLSDKV